MTKKSKKTETPTAEVFSLERFKSKRTKDAKATTPPSAKPKETAKPKRAPSAEPFVQLPYERFMQAYGKLSAAALYVAIELERLHFKSFDKKNPVSLPNKALKGLGMHRSTKRKALHQLQAAGLVTCTQVGQGSYSVTLTWYPVL